MPPLKIDFIDDLREVPAAAWNGLAGVDYPFLRHEFLLALEASGSACAASGWQPSHLLAWRGGRLVGLLPLYRKRHSFGEYVFDWGWAEAYERHGLAYYPKLLSAVPFTPCQGPRLVTAEAGLVDELLPALREYALGQRCSSLHLLFPDAPGQAELDRQPLRKRLGVQFHWRNPGCADFAELLQLFTSKRRKNIRREREQVRAAGFEFDWVEGAEVTEAQLLQFYRYYQATYRKRGQRGYLSLDFFRRVLTDLPEQVLLILARRGGETLAAAWFFKGGGSLYGRYWGCLQEFAHLHFETCYYQGLDYCLAHGLAHFDAGAQGEHKLLRGFRPHYTASYHWLAEPAFDAAVADFLHAEAQQVQGYLQAAEAALPYRQA